MKRNNKIRVGNLLRIKDNYFGPKKEKDFIIGLIIQTDNKKTTIYFMRNNKSGVKEYQTDQLSNISRLLSAKAWERKN